MLFWVQLHHQETKTGGSRSDQEIEEGKRARGWLSLLLTCLKSIESREQRPISHAEEFQTIDVAAPLRRERQ